MSGLLGENRDCLRGHGPMAKHPGYFTLSGGTLVPRSMNAIEALNQKTGPDMQVVPDGRVYVLSVWRCNTCGTVELVDKE